MAFGLFGGDKNGSGKQAGAPAFDEVRQIGDPVLRAKAAEVTEFDGRLKALEKRMIDTMYAEEGVGLAAPQIGVSLAMFVMDCEGVEATVCNPVLTIDDEELLIENEGCLSVVGKRADRERFAKATVTGQDINGDPITVSAEGYAARCLQHEYDHLQGRLYCDPGR